MQLGLRYSNSLPALESLLQALPNWARVERPGPLERVPQRLEERLGAERVVAMTAAYRAGASTRELAERFEVGLSTVTRLLRRQGVEIRPRGRYC